MNVISQRLVLSHPLLPGSLLSFDNYFLPGRHVLIITDFECHRQKLGHAEIADYTVVCVYLSIICFQLGLNASEPMLSVPVPSSEGPRVFLMLFDKVDARHNNTPNTYRTIGMEMKSGGAISIMTSELRVYTSSSVPLNVGAILDRNG